MISFLVLAVVVLLVWLAFQPLGIQVCHDFTIWRVTAQGQRLDRNGAGPNDVRDLLRRLGGYQPVPVLHWDTEPASVQAALAPGDVLIFGENGAHSAVVNRFGRIDHLLQKPPFNVEPRPKMTPAEAEAWIIQNRTDANTLQQVRDRFSPLAGKIRGAPVEVWRRLPRTQTVAAVSATNDLVRGFTQARPFNARTPGVVPFHFPLAAAARVLAARILLTARIVGPQPACRDELFLQGKTQALRVYLFRAGAARGGTFEVLLAEPKALDAVRAGNLRAAVRPFSFADKPAMIVSKVQLVTVG